MIRHSLESAVSLMLKYISRMQTEQVYLSCANGRILCEDIVSPMDMPPFDRSPLDGYALRAADTADASQTQPVSLAVIDEVNAGGYTEKTIKAGEAVRIMTGAAMPSGSDCVVAQENTDYGEKTVAVCKSHSPYENYCFKGEDIGKGDIVINKGTKIRYMHQGILASLGFTHVKAVKKPVIALLTTGDEVVPSGEPLTKGKIYNSNLYLMESRMLELGIKPELIFSLPDDAKNLALLIAELAQSADLIITTGGVSVGKKDILHETLDILNANTVFKGVDFKPGSPAIFSMYNNKPVLSLSGNPFAASTSFELLARPILFKMTNDPSFQTRRVTAISREGFDKKSSTRRFIRAQYEDRSVIIPKSTGKTDRHSSGVIGSMMGCNCLVDIEAGNTGVIAGDEVSVILLDTYL